MPRLNVVTPEHATGQTKVLYDGIKRAVGGVPNIYLGVGNSASALEGVLHIGEVLKKGQLTAAEIEAIKLAVSQAYGCDYCLAAHTMLGKNAGLTESDTLSIRRGTPRQPKLAALIGFVNAVIPPQARVPDEAVRAVRQAGYNDAQIAETLLTIPHTVFTNLFNRVHQTPLDFPAAARI